jgi:hypothetical protein
MVETRIARRVRVNRAARIEFGGIKTLCTIRDLSTTGAALQIQEVGARIPAAFTLLIPQDGLRLACRVVWRTEFRLGVVFD